MPQNGYPCKECGKLIAPHDGWCNRCWDSMMGTASHKEILKRLEGVIMSKDAQIALLQIKIDKLEALLKEHVLPYQDDNMLKKEILKLLTPPSSNG